MRINFYSPLKSPNHPVPSGDRLMARQLIAAMREAGHEVTIASELRAFLATPDGEAHERVRAAADDEVARLSAQFERDGAPDVWFAYHSYYKTPDLIGPALARRFNIAYITAEASYSQRRNVGLWTQLQADLLDAVRMAAVNICFTERDRKGLQQAAPDASFAALPPFLDASAFAVLPPQPKPGHLIAIAMMRPGDKMDSYRMLADALEMLADMPWTLSIVGDGQTRAELEARFAVFPAGRITFEGEMMPAEIAALLSKSAVYTWPGCGEAYGLAYLEAQAAGVPVVAQATAGVPEVVQHERTGLLTPPGDVAAYAGAIADLLRDETLRKRLAAGARHFATQERSIARAAVILDGLLMNIGQRHGG